MEVTIPPPKRPEPEHRTPTVGTLDLSSVLLLCRSAAAVRAQSSAQLAGGMWPESCCVLPSDTTGTAGDRDQRAGKGGLWDPVLVTDIEGRTNAEVASTTAPPDRPRGFTRWIAANVGSAVPQSMAPITFGLATLSQGDLNGGALMMTAMTVAQVIGAVPIAAAGRRFCVTAYARVLTAFRTLAFVGLVLAIAGGAPVAVLVVAASLAGLVNGAIFGLLRALLNDMVASNKLPRALGVAATANELVFVSGPILASTIGGASVIAAVAIMAITSALPLVALPRIAHRTPPASTRVPPELIRVDTMVWLLAAGSAAACVASVEVGAVALALRHELAPSAALLFTVPLCVGSVLGGVWVSVRNRRLRQRTVVAMMLLTVVGMVAVAWDAWIGSVIAGVVLVGLFLAPLGMSFSLFIDDVLPPARRAEGFALLRTSKSVGLITASAVIAFGSLAASFLVSAALAFVSAVIILTVHARGVGRKGSDEASATGSACWGRRRS
ncbi:MFS transporter [Actinopolymorpha sp. B9G3]|uniref:MFS transporter n=1 Tax=Actinopolymorpha sp. B9G3 TaxID=3158970 RepID=UPI0032D8C741